MKQKFIAKTVGMDVYNNYTLQNCLVILKSNIVNNALWLGNVLK